MLLDRLFRPRASKGLGEKLYARCVEQSRQPMLYAELKAPDTVDGRFEIYTLHVVLLLDRLRGHGEAATDISQDLFDTYVKALDHALRELGVGDLSVGRKMRKLGEAFYGRGKSYDAAFVALPETASLRSLLERTVHVGVGDAPVTLLVNYVLDQRAALAGQPLERLLAGDVSWATP